MRLRLRSRLGLTLGALVIPFAVGLSLYHVRAQRQAFEQATAASAIDRMENGERFLCEDDPELWPRRAEVIRRLRERADRARGAKGRGKARLARRELSEIRRTSRPEGLLGVWAYDTALESRNPAAPPFHAELRSALEAGEELASVPAAPGSRWVAVRMPWDEGPCAVLLVERPASDDHAVLMHALGPSLITSAAAILIAILAAGPIVTRIRRLTDAAERPPDAAADLPLEGGDEIGDLGRALAQSRARIRAQLEELERRDAALRGYMANTTHDVMIPLTVLSGHLSAMERAVEAGRPVDAHRVREALGEAHYLASLLQNLNAAARLEMTAREPRSSPVDLNDVVERVAARHGPYARQQEVSLDFAVPEERLGVLGDVTLVEQAVGNLVHNAARYNRPGGHVALVLERASGRFVLRVMDDGPGIPDEELRRVAERGYRGDRARSRHPHGMGLGLSIARDVAERHGWALRFDSPPAGGLVVTLEGALASSSARPM